MNDRTLTLAPDGQHAHAQTQALANAVSCNESFPGWWWPNTSPLGYTWVVTAPATTCAGDVHVFPCPHCKKCRCGKAHLEA